MVNTIQTSRHTSLEKYSSHFIRKGHERVRGELETEQRQQYIDPQLFHAIAELLSHPAELLNRGPWRPSLCWVLVLTPRTATTDSKLQTLISNWLTSCRTGLYNCLTSTCFSERRTPTQLNPSTIKVIFGYLRQNSPIIYTGAFLIWQLGRVGGQYVTNFKKTKKQSNPKVMNLL